MIGSSPRHAAFALIATTGLVASNLAAGSAARPEGAALSLSAPTVTLADRCDLRFPIATVHIRAHNRGDAPSLPSTIRVRDTAHELAGTAELPQLAAHESRSIDVPVSLDPDFDASKDPAAISPDHTFGVYLSDPHTPLLTSVADVSTAIPSGFCVRSTAFHDFKSSSRTKAQSPSLATQRALLGSQAQTLFAPTSLAAPVVAVPVATPTNGPLAVTSMRSGIVPETVATPIPPDSVVAKRKIVAFLLTAPQGLRAASSVGDCEAHLHAFSRIGGVASCQSMLSGGNLVVVWDAPPEQSASGYRVYALVGVERGPSVATVSDRKRTLATLPPLTSGPIPQCYVVTATYGSSESSAGPAYCPREATVTRTLGAAYSRSAWQDRAHKGGLSGFVTADGIPDGPVVGYYYAENQSTFGDSSYNKIHRYAVAFDVDSLRNKRLVSAQLQFTIQLSYGAGNNHSCATTVAGGTEFWWKSDAATWIDGSFNNSPARLTDTGPVVTADVTNLIAPILAGSPNYGLVIRNDNENLDAFMNAQCETNYGNPQLQIVYYDK